jgi:peptidoglycan/xylan/chitin deacetylase (PgdA/CDA1 family)
VHSGSVILMHDGGGNRSQTVAALPTILKTLEAQGYGFRTLTC